MIYHRVLNINDIDAIKDLMDSKPSTLMGLHDPTFVSVFTNYLPEWLTSPLFYSLGVFEDQLLIAFVIARESEYSPSWTWVHWLTRPGFIQKLMTKNFADELNELQKTDRDFFNEMEINRKLNRFFFIISEEAGYKGLRQDIVKGHDRLQSYMKRFNFGYQNYYVITDCVVEAGQLPVYDYQKALMGNRTWPVRVYIRMAVLKNPEV